jgi:hypothetical protein
MADGLPQTKDYLGLLAQFPRYLDNAWHDLDGGMGYFGDPSHLEAGARAMGNVVFTAALLAADPDYVPAHGNREDLLRKARAGLAYMTHGHVTGHGACADGKRWGGVWQSAWWATRMALGAKLIWPQLDEAARAAVERVVVYEADIQLPRIVPTGLAEDTKAEENAWDAEILATACALFPAHPHRSLWWEKLCEFACNTFSVASDLHSDARVDGKPVRDWVHTVNLHSDFTLENHGAYHFCYVASPLHSLAWAVYALRSQSVAPPEALAHHVAEVWARVKPTFMGRRFAYAGGQDWARYTYGAYFIVPALVWLQSLLEDGDASAIELARLDTLAEEQAENSDGSFFGKRFTQPHYQGQPAKYETDCYANIALAYCLRRTLEPKVLATPPDSLAENLSACHVSPECGIAYLRSPKLFASFSWRTLTGPHPLALFVPLADESLAEWQANNLCGRLLLWREDPSAVWIRGMKAEANGFRIQGTVVYRGRGGRILYTHELDYSVDAQAQTSRIRSRFVAQAKFFLRRAEGLCLAIPNDRFNGFSREVISTSGSQQVVFDPAKRPYWLQGRNLFQRIIRRLRREIWEDGPQYKIAGDWVNIDGVFGIINLDKAQPGFLLRSPLGRNLPDASLHYDILYSPVRNLNRNVVPGEEILSTDFLLIAGDEKTTRQLAEKP